MGIFGGRRKAEQEEAERRQREEETERQRLAAKGEVDRQRRRENADKIQAWFQALKDHRPPGATALTDEILEKAGPYPFPPKEWEDREGRLQYVVDLSSAQTYGRGFAEDYYVTSLGGGREDALYWKTVKEYCEGILGTQ